MWDAIKQWCIIIGAGVLALPVAMQVPAHMDAVNGLIGVPLIRCGHLIEAVVWVLISFVWFGVLSIVSGRLTNRNVGMLIFGLGWVLIARSSALTGDVLRQTGEAGGIGAGFYIGLALTIVVFGVLTGAVVLAMVRVVPSNDDEQSPLLSGPNLTTLAAACILSAAFVWVFVHTDLKGQAVYGTIAGFAVGIMITRLIWPKSTDLILYAVPFMVGLIGYIVAIFTMGGEAMEHLVSGSLWPLLRPMPLDYLGSGLMGVSIGIGMAHSFAAEPEEQANGKERRKPDQGTEVRLIRGSQVRTADQSE